MLSSNSLSVILNLCLESSVLELRSIFNFLSNFAAEIVQSIILRDVLFHCFSIVSLILPIPAKM